jgi:peptide/nickel transport system ATP-binding protein
LTRPSDETDPSNDENEPVVAVDGLKVWFSIRSGVLSGLLRKPGKYVHAVDGVKLDIRKHEIFCLAGESGSGKSTTGLAILRLVDPTEGSVVFKGEEILTLKRKQLKKIRRWMQMIFQDPYESLNPRMTVFDAVAEPLEIHGLTRSEKEKRGRVVELLQSVELTPPENFIHKFPHELSGGQRQRVAIAAALALNPEFLVADEPVSMLDLSIRAEILNLLLSLRDKLGLAILFITHDLSTAYHIADRIAIMYLGKVMETGSAEDVITNSLHPYTKALIAAVPGSESKEQLWRKITKAEIPSAINIPSGCRFHDRCPYATDKCSAQQPELVELRPGHLVACHYADQIQ